MDHSITLYPTLDKGVIGRGTCLPCILGAYTLPYHTLVMHHDVAYPIQA